MLQDRIYLKINTALDKSNTKKDMLRFEKKYKESGEFLNDMDLKLNYITKGPNNPWFGKIHSICYGFMHEGDELVDYLKGDEKELLETLLKILKYGDNSKKFLTIYNQEFILPYITTRLFKHDIDIRQLPKQIDHLNKKPWDIRGVLDYYSYFKGVGWFRPSFLDVCAIKNLPTDFLYNNERELTNKQLEKYTRSYLGNLISLDRKVNMLGEVVETKPLKKETKTPKEEVKPSFDNPVIKEIYESQTIDGEQADKIITKFKGSGEEDEVLTIVKSALMVDNKEKDVYDIGGYRLLLEAFGQAISNYDGLFDSLKSFNKKEANLLLKKYKDITEENKKDLIDTVTIFVEKKTTKSDRTKEALKYFVKEI